MESDTVVEGVEEDGNVVLCSVDRPSAWGAWGQRRRSQWTTGRALTMKERGEVAAKELVLGVPQDMAHCGIAVENCALLGEDENGDVDELGNDGIGPALLAGKLEWLLLVSGSSMGMLVMLLVMLVLMLVLVRSSAEGAVDRDWVLHY